MSKLFPKQEWFPNAFEVRTIINIFDDLLDELLYFVFRIGVNHE